MKTPLLEACKIEYLLADGGVSTTLRRMAGDGAVLVERLNLTNPDLVLQMHREFIDAGAQCLTTNTFSANTGALIGTTDEECTQICMEGVRLARKAAGGNGYIIASVGATSDASASGQIRALAAAEPDAIAIETLTSLQKAQALASLAREHAPGVPVIISFSFEKFGADKFRLPRDRTTLQDLTAALDSLDVDAFGVNCGKGVDAFEYATLVSGIREKTGKPIIARPSAGDPVDQPGDVPEYPDDPEIMAQGIWGMVRAGANIIGGCCGVSHEHIAAFRAELDMLG